jgi:hypothetical protein
VIALSTVPEISQDSADLEQLRSQIRLKIAEARVAIHGRRAEGKPGVKPFDPSRPLRVS